MSNTPSRSSVWLLVPALAALSLAACTQKEAAPAELDLAKADLSRPAFTTADAPDDVSYHVPGAIVVDFKDGTTKEQFDVWEQDFGVDLELSDEEEGVDSAITFAEGVDPADLESTLAKIRANENVEAAEPMMRFEARYTPNDPSYAKQWNLKMLDLPKAWDTARGKGVIVAVLDTGIAYEDYDGFKQVPDLKGTKFVAGYDFVNRDAHANDDHGHGTHVAGTIAQATNNGEGVAGVAFESTLMAVKVLDHFGSGTSDKIADAIRWASDHGAKVINMSLGGGGRSAVLENAVKYARGKGTVVVCAAGNGGRGVVEFPGAYPGSVAVGAVGPKGTKAPYSSWGKELDVAAPGGDKSQGDEAGILQNTIDPKDPSKSVYASYQGTSMATPHVAAVAALLFSAGAKTPDQVEKALFASAVQPDGSRAWTEQYGHGVINAARALTALRQMGVGDLLPVDLEALEQPSGTGFEVRADPADDVSARWSFPPFAWQPLAGAAGLLALVLLTLGRKERPGYLNILLSPGFLVPLVLTTSGVFFARWLGEPSSLMAQDLLLPLPEWLNKIIFGRGTLANPIVYSAAIPLALSLIAIKAKGIRPAVGGLAIGFAGILGYSAWAHAPALAWLPFTALAMPWLIGNALLCLFISRAMLKKAAP